MILTCPSCGTRYKTDRARLVAPGSNVRCAKCSHVWFHAVVESEPEAGSDYAGPAEEAPAPAMAAMAPSMEDTHRPLREAEPERVHRTVNWANVGGWAGLILFLAAVGWAVVAYRQPIAELWPNASSFYALIGMPVNVRGLTFEGVTYTMGEEEGQRMLSITGSVVNIGLRELPLPKVKISLTDVERHELYAWDFEIGATSLKPGEKIDFVQRLTNPPEKAAFFDVSFQNDGAGSVSTPAAPAEHAAPSEGER